MSTFVAVFKDETLLLNEQAYKYIERMDVAGVDVDWHIGLFYILLHAESFNFTFLSVRILSS